MTEIWIVKYENKEDNGEPGEIPSLVWTPCPKELHKFFVLKSHTHSLS